MYQKIIVLIVIGLSLAHGCAPKFCVPRKELKCVECSDPDDAFCTNTQWVYCDDEAVERTYARIGGNAIDDGPNKNPYADGKHKYACYYIKLYKYANLTELDMVIQGCVKGISFTQDHPMNGNYCRCARDYCNAYDKQPFSEMRQPNKFYSPPYYYQKYDENGVHLYCPAP